MNGNETKQERDSRWDIFVDDAGLNLKSDKFIDICLKAIKKYGGDYRVLENAIGSLILAMFLGVKPIRIIHSPKSLRKYEQILDITFSDLIEQGFLSEVTDMSDRSIGYNFAVSVSAFWDVVNGKYPLEGRPNAEPLDGVITDLIS
jgi:hypothetical protein